MINKIQQYKLLFFFSLTLFLGVFLFSFGIKFFDPTETRAASKTWDGDAGDGLWTNPLNWSDDHVPTINDDVTIDTAVVGSTILNAPGDIYFNSLTLTGYTGKDLWFYLDGTFKGGSLIIDNKVVVYQNNINLQILKYLTIKNGGKLTHGYNNTSQGNVVNFFVKYDVDIQVGGSINVDGLGYAGGTIGNNGKGPGYGSTGSSGGGGANAGNGGEASGIGGVGYFIFNDVDTGASNYYSGSLVSTDSLLGSGGGGGVSNSGGAGGGSIILKVNGNLKVNGTITADGNNGIGNGGGGAGGNIKIFANTVEGTPVSFTATGGNSGTGGGGGGGGISIEYWTSNSILSTGISMNGGTGNQAGGSGILSINQDGFDSESELYLDNKGNYGAQSQHSGFLVANSLTLKDGASFNVAENATLEFTGSNPLSNGDSDSVFLLSSGGTLITPATTTLSNYFYIEDGAIWEDSSSTDIFLEDGATFSQKNFTTSSEPLWFDDFTIESGAVLTHEDNSTTQASVLNMKFNNLTVDSGGAINVDGKGYDGGTVAHPNGYGPGAGENTSSCATGGGGGHGGVGTGTRGGCSAGEGALGGGTYCSQYSPQTIGSGGTIGSTYVGGAGGGLIMLQVLNDFTLNGVLSADGVSSTGAVDAGGGGGAGGGIWVRTKNLYGATESLGAVGGSGGGSGYSGGPGGGGCVFAYYSGEYNLTGSLSAIGGVGYSGGEVYDGISGALAKNQEPRIVFNTFGQRRDGSKIADISFSIDDSDDDDSIQIKAEYKAGATCSESTSDPTLDTTVSSTYGTPLLNNDNVYQISFVTTSLGANTLALTWPIDTDVPTADGLYCVQLTTNDGMSTGTFFATTTFDVVAPTAPGALTVASAGDDNADLNFGIASVDTNFYKYMVFYSTSSPATTSDTEINTSTVSGLDYIDYNGSSGFSLSSLLSNTTYFINIWAYDLFGLVSSAIEANFTTIISGTPGVNLSKTSTDIVEGGADPYTIVLAKQPTASVTINILESSDFISLSTTTINFTTSTWDIPISVNVISADDGSNNGSQSITISHSASSTDLDYNNISISSMTVSLSDNDGPSGCTDCSVVITPIGSIQLNDGAEYINTTTLHITASSTNATQIQLGEAPYLGNNSFGNCVFSTAFLEIFTEYDSFSVSSGDGLKKVCALFKSSSGHTDDDVKVINLDTEKPVLSNVGVDTSGVYPRFFGSVSDNNLKGLKVFVSSTNYIILDDSFENGNWEVSLPFTNIGQYKAEIYAVDNASNTSDVTNKDFSIIKEIVQDCSAFPPDLIEITYDKQIIPIDGDGLVEFVKLKNGNIANNIITFRYKAGCPYQKLVWNEYLKANFYIFPTYSFINPGDFFPVYGYTVYRDNKTPEKTNQTSAYAFYVNFLASYRQKVGDKNASLPDKINFFFGIESVTGVYTYGNQINFKAGEVDVVDYCNRDPKPYSCVNDYDKDTVPDIYDNCQFVANKDQVDGDSDGFGNVCDNCPLMSNSGQSDRDKNGIGDACDVIDTDNDGIPDSKDNCPDNKNFNQLNIDGDSFGDICDVCPVDPLNDRDQDGLCAEVDNCPEKNNPGQEDEDSDGVGDVCEILEIDLCPLDPKKLEPGLCGCGVVEDTGDRDKDRMMNCRDLCPDDPKKTSPGLCGCGNTEDCDLCPNDPDKRTPGVCGCGVSDVDSDSDGIANCKDECPNDATNKCKDIPLCVGPDCNTEPPCTGPECGGSNDGGDTNDGGNVTLGTITEVIKDLPQLLVTNVTQLSNTVGDFIDTVTEKTMVAVRQVIDNPQVEAVNKTYVAPSLVAAGVANVAVGMQLGEVLAILRSIFAQPLLLKRLKKKKKWGVIYNAFTKEPISLATIRVLNNETNQIIRTQVTDNQGRYLLVLDPGTYKIEIDKAGFSGFSEYLMNKNEDAKYINLYHGNIITITEKATDINYNIPLDPTNENKEITKLLRDKLLNTVKYVVSFSGLTLTVISFIITPTAVVAAFFFAHLLFFSLFYKFSHSVPPPHLGQVTDTENEPVENTIVRVFDSVYNKLVNSTITNQKGQYAILVGPSTYYVTYEKPGYELAKTEIIDLSSEKTNGMGGIIDVNEKLKKV